MRRLLISLVLAGSLSATAAPAVLGHECYIANRSLQGDTGALHSARWARISLSDIFSFIHMFVGGTPLTSDQITWAVNEAIAEGLPADGWVVRSDKTIGDGSKNPNLADGKGLEHLADASGPKLIGIYLAAVGH